MIGNYRNVHTDILCRLFGTNCCSFYGSDLWGCNSTGFSRIVTEWHKAVRRVIQLPYCTHRWLLGPLSGQRNIIEQLHCKTVRFIVRGINHTNPIVKLICNIALTSARSPVGANMAFLRCKYGADFDTSVHTLLNCINVYHELDESHCSILNVLGELYWNVPCWGHQLWDINCCMCVCLSADISLYCAKNDSTDYPEILWVCWV